MTQNKKIIEPDFLYLFGNNGWMWCDYDGWNDEDYRKYKSSFLSLYQVDIYAVVSETESHVKAFGNLGVLWLELAGYPDFSYDEYRGYTYSDLQDIAKGFEKAEENLVRCGIPFAPSYLFRSPKKANLKRRNEATRRKLNIDYWERLYKGEVK